MDVLPIDLIAIIAVVMGVSIVLVPVIGLTARFALKPFVESLGHFFQSRNVEESVRIVERRMALMEAQLESMEGTLSRLADASEFHRDLRAGTTASLPGGQPTAPPGDARS